MILFDNPLNHIKKYTNIQKSKAIHFNPDIQYKELINKREQEPKPQPSLSIKKSQIEN